MQSQPRLTHVNLGKWQQKGAADQLLWQAINSKAASHPSWTHQQIANSLHCSKSTVKKVYKHFFIREITPCKHGTRKKRKMEAHHINLMVALLGQDEKGKAYTIKDAQHELEKVTGDQWRYNTLNHNLNLKHSQQKAVFEDPQKWRPANCHLYINFLLWQMTTLIKQHFLVKVFDEAQID